MTEPALDTEGPPTAVAASAHPTSLAYAQHVNPSFIKLLGLLGYGRIWTKARGCTLVDHEGREYLDFLAGFGSVNLGHNHPELRRRMRALLDDEPLYLNHIGPGAEEAALAKALAERMPDGLDVCLLASSGAEAVEAGMKLARAATGREGFVSCEGGFHGTNFGALSIMGAPRMRKPFEPLLASCRQVPFGDLEALERALHPKAGKRAAAFVVEPILGEGGVVIPPDGYLQGAAELCRKRGALLVVDEVQTGLGRTGSFLASTDMGVVPDVVVLAKALSGGMAPISCAVTTKEWHRKAYGSTDRFDLHSSTFEGNALSCTAALATLEILDDEHLVEASKERGLQLLEGLKARLHGHPLVVDVRGQGLLVGVELGPTDAGLINKLIPGLTRVVSEQMFGQWAAVRLLERGIVCQPAAHRWNVLRLEPPLTVTPEHIQTVVDEVGDLLDEYRSLPKLIKDVSSRFSAQWRDGWAF